MKSIANQYRDLKEGRMSQFNFMRNLRMSMPQYITNVTSFNDAVKILKNKAILTEADINELSPQTKYNAAIKAADKIDATMFSSDSNYKKALRQGNKFVQEIDPVLKKAIEDFGKSLGFETVIEKSTTGFRYEPIVQIKMGKDISNPSIKVVVTKNTDKIEGGFNLPNEAAERRLGILIKQIQQKELDVELKEAYDGPSEPMGNEALGDYYEAVGEELEDIARQKYNLDEKEIEQMFESEWHSGKNDDAIEKYYKDGDEPSVVAERIIEDYIQVDSDIEDQIKRMEDEESGKYTKFQDFEGGLSEEELNEYEHTYRKINGVCYKIDDEGNRTRVADHYCRYSEDLNEAKKKKEPKSELHPNQIHPQELRMGIKVELEHTDDLDKAKKIALDHLKENPFYYTALKLSGIESPSAPKAKAPKDAPKKAKKKDATELVDKANQMVKVKELKKKLEEAKLNIDGEPNSVVKHAMGYVDGPNANPTLKALSKDIEFQQSSDPNEALLRYGYWERLPKEAIQKLELQFDVEENSDFDEDTGYIFVYSLVPKKSPARNLGASLEMGASKAGQMDAFKESLEKVVRETIAEYYDGRDNLDETNDVSPENIKNMRDWLKDVSWEDMESEEIDDISDSEVIKAIKSHYDGGLKAFLKDEN